MKIRRVSIVLVLILLLFVGCSENVKVTGNVKFEDGSPLTFGTVVAESDSGRATGEINEKGIFKLDGAKKGAGVLPGKYKVWLVGTEENTFDEETGVSTSITRVDAKYSSSSTTDLSYDIDPQNKVLNIVLPNQ